MAKKLKEKVDALLRADGKLVEGPRTILRAGKRSVVLIGQDGKMTKAGDYYQSSTGQELGPGGYDRSQVPQRVGNTEYVKLRNGKRVKTDAHLGRGQRRVQLHATRRRVL